MHFASETAYRGEKLPFDGLCDALARKLAMTGYDVLRPLNRNVGIEAVRYIKNPEKDNSPWKQVVIEEVQGMPSRQFALNLGHKNDA